MAVIGPCPKCVGNNVKGEYLQVTTSGSNLVLSEGAAPRKGAYFIVAHACMDCGYLELCRSETGSLVPPPL